MKQAPHFRIREISGFTLVELLITVAIIGTLAAVVLPRLSAARDKALVARAQLEIDGLIDAMALLRQDSGVYPNGADSYCRTSAPADNEVDLSDPDMGLTGNGAGTFTGWEGPYMQVAEDPWGNPYFLDEDYQCMASTTGCQGIDDAGNDSSVIVSCGPNEALSGEGCVYDTDNIVYRLCDTS